MLIARSGCTSSAVSALDAWCRGGFLQGLRWRRFHAGLQIPDAHAFCHAWLVKQGSLAISQTLSLLPSSAPNLSLSSRLFDSRGHFVLSFSSNDCFGAFSFLALHFHDARSPFRRPAENRGGAWNEFRTLTPCLFPPRTLTPRSGRPDDFGDLSRLP